MPLQHRHEHGPGNFLTLGHAKKCPEPRWLPFIWQFQRNLCGNVLGNWKAKPISWRSVQGAGGGEGGDDVTTAPKGLETPRNFFIPL